MSKIQSILEDIKLNNINNTNIVPSKNESLEKIVNNLSIGQAMEDINKIINLTLKNNLENINLNNKLNIFSNDIYISDELLIKNNKNYSMDKDININEEKYIPKNLYNLKDSKISRNYFNPKILQIISYNDKNNKLSKEFNVNNTFFLNNNNVINTGKSIKNDNITKIPKYLKSKDKNTNKKKDKNGEKNFYNKFINIDK